MRHGTALALLLVACNNEDPPELWPEVDAGEDFEADEAAQVTLDGQATDPDGEIEGLTWSQVGGSVAVDLDGQGGAATFAAPGVKGLATLDFRLTATDDRGNEAFDEVAVLIHGVNTLPVANAGPDVAGLEATTVTVSGAGSDSDGTIAGYAWSQLSGPAIALDGATTAVASFFATEDDIGTIELQLVVTDDEGGTAADTVLVSVQPDDDLPTADAGLDQTVDEGATATLSGSGTDPDGTIVATLWDQIGTPGVALADRTAATTTFVAPSTKTPLDLTLQLTVEDDGGGSDTDTVVVHVQPVNALPTADAGPDQDEPESSSLTLTGFGADTDGTIASYAWAQIGGPVTLIDADGDTVDIDLPDVDVDAVVTLRLTVTDDEGGTAHDDVAIDVRDGNDAPIANAGNDQNVQEGATVTVTGSGTDPDGTIASTLWDQVDGPAIVLADRTAASTTFVAPATTAATEITLQLTVVDDVGEPDTDLVVIMVLPDNLPPAADAGPDTDGVELDTLTLTGFGSDDDGTIEDFTWQQIAGPVVAIDDVDADVIAVTLPAVSVAGVARLRLTVTDNEGGTDFDDVDVTVRNGSAPVADAGPDQEADALQTVTLAGSATDDRAIASLHWDQIAGPAVTIDDPSAGDTTVTLPSVASDEVVTLRLTATDDDGLTDTDTVSIGVLTPNVAPTADAGPDQDVFLAVHVPLDGTGSSDPDGTIVGWQWTQLSGPAVTLSNAATATASFTAPIVASDAVIVLQLEVTDDEGADDTDTVSVVVRSNLYPPVASAGPDQEVGTGSAVVLDGSATDEDGVVVSYEWTQIGGPAVTLISPNTEDAAFIAPASVSCADVIRLRLTVHDDDDLVDTDVIGIFVTGGTSPTMPLGTLLDLESGTQGIAFSGTQWEWGIPTTGPSAAYSGVRVLATNLDGHYVDNATDVLCVPGVDLSASDAATFSVRAWVLATGGDGLSVEVLDPDLGWTSLSTVKPGYHWTDWTGAQAWRDLRYRSDYLLVHASLDDYVGGPAWVRIVFRSDHCCPWFGAYVDDIGIHDETDDPDADGLPGIRNEISYGSDPFVMDSDGDGWADGDEVDSGTSPENPAWYPGVAPWTPPHADPLEIAGGGLATTGVLWEWGLPGEPPLAAYSGVGAWTTDLDAYYFDDAREILWLPPLDLTAATDPTLSFRLHSRTGGADGLGIEIKSPGGAWEVVPSEFPLRTVTDPTGKPVFPEVRYRNEYKLTAQSLAPWLGDLVQVRLTFRSDCCGNWFGPTLDDIGLHEESDDPDDDGILGVIDESTLHGTDPFRADTDGDGHDDGPEEDDGTDPLDPADFDGALPLVPGSWLDFEAGPQGVATSMTLWKHGVPASGPARATSGIRTWAATTSNTFYFDEAEELVYLPPLDLTGAVDPVLSFRIWSRISGWDGLSLEVNPGDGWHVLEAATPTQSTDGKGSKAFMNAIGYRTEYVLAAFDLATYEGLRIRIRMRFRSDCCSTWLGPYIDDVRLDNGATDADGDGVAGILDEYLDEGTDPYDSDSDNDGQSDGSELSAGYDPLNPSSYAAAVVLSPGDPTLTFEATPSGAHTLGTMWEWGTTNVGPGTGYSGSRMWATDLDNYYFDGALEPLYLPPLDLTGTADEALTFRMWSRGSTWDGVTLEWWDGDSWEPVVPDAPAYQQQVGSGEWAWSTNGYLAEYVLVALDLGGLPDEVINTRLMMRSDCCGGWWGFYVDDLSLHDETMDPDGDGLVGVLDELSGQGTDPLRADSDTDGVSDGDEVDDGTDPLDPADYSGGAVLVPGSLLDFEDDDGGLRTLRTLWKRGTPTPIPAKSGTKVWATNPTGFYFDGGADESVHLPPIDLAGTTAPRLGFWMYVDSAEFDGFSMQIQDGLGWQPLVPSAPAYDGKDGVGFNAWVQQHPGNAYVFATVPLDAWAGERVRVRFDFRSNCCSAFWGAYVDDVQVWDD